MSLLARSQQVAPEVVSGAAIDWAEAFGHLRGQVNEFLPVEDAAALVARNSEWAKNEVRAACRRAFAAAYWREFSQEELDRLTEQLLDSMFGFGPLEPLLADEDVTEIMVNGSSKVFYEKDGVIWPAAVCFVDDAQVRQVVDRILGPLGRRVDEASPMVDARLPQGHRVNAVIPPITPDGPCITIRKFASKVLSLEDLEARGSMSSTVRQFLQWAVTARKSVAVSGGTGAGKTTLLNALSGCIPTAERIVTIEDSAELQFGAHPDVVRMEARRANAEGLGEVTIRALVVNALRMRPDRIVVGECRGAEALDMLQAMNTGHDGSMTTLHANSPEEVISRLTTMVRYAADIPVEVIEEYVARAFDVVVQMTRGLDGRRYISAIAEFGYDAQRRRSEVRMLYARGVGAGCAAGGSWMAAPSWLDEVPALGLAEEGEVAAWTRACGL